MDLDAMRQARVEADQAWEMEKSDFIEKNADGLGTYLRMVPKLYQRVVYKSWSGKSSMREAIKAKCLDCCAYQKEEIKGCTVKSCPLWNIRPYQEKKTHH